MKGTDFANSAPPTGVRIGPITVGGGAPLVLIAGPCVIESPELAFQVAAFLKDLTGELKIPFIFKASYDKANRSSIRSFRGPGIEDGLAVLARIKQNLDVPVLSDVHTVDEVDRAAEVLDVLQIPAFLCRQTDLLLAAAATGRPLNIKKGQFMAPWDMRQVVVKVETAGRRHQVMLTERGAMFGYQNLVVDFRSIAIMQAIGCPVVFDATHSVQLPGAAGECSGGQREFVPLLARAAVAVGANALFMEVHPDPDRALCDGANSLPLDSLKSLLTCLKQIRHAAGNGVASPDP